MLRSARLRVFIIGFGLALIGMFSLTRSARAWPYYFEFGGTTASFSNPSAILLSQGKTASSSVSSAYGIPVTFGIQLQDSQRGILFALALQNRYLAGTSGAGSSFTVMSTSPMLRIEFWKIVLGAGYTPLVWQSMTFKRDGGIDSVLTLEAQLLFPITPEIDFGLQAARTAYSSSTYGSSATAMEYGAFFRLNFGISEAGVNDRKKFKGWRYPLGAPLNH